MDFCSDPPMQTLSGVDIKAIAASICSLFSVQKSGKDYPVMGVT
jgi:hypothetical protein